MTLAIGTITGAVMAYMFVKILAPLFTLFPTSAAVPADRLATPGDAPSGRYGPVRGSGGAEPPASQLTSSCGASID
jgi:hypothetical protein